jgi:hypothetical protein
VFLVTVELDVPSFKDLQESLGQQRLRLSSSNGKEASEPFISSTYFFFLALFTIYATHEIMSSRLFTFLYLYPRCSFACG